MKGVFSRSRTSHVLKPHAIEHSDAAPAAPSPSPSSSLLPSAPLSLEQLGTLSLGNTVPEKAKKDKDNDVLYTLVRQHADPFKTRAFPLLYDAYVQLRDKLALLVPTASLPTMSKKDSVEARKESIAALLSSLNRERILRTSPPVLALLQEADLSVSPSPVVAVAATSAFETSPGSSSPVMPGASLKEASGKIVVQPLRLIVGMEPSGRASAPAVGASARTRVERFVKVRAIHDADAGMEVEAEGGGVAPLLQFRRGDRFYEVQCLDAVGASAPLGWCEGWFAGRRGYYPRSYVVRDDETLL